MTTQSEATATRSEAPDTVTDPPAASVEAVKSSNSIGYWLRPDTPEEIRAQARQVEGLFNPNRFAAANYRGQLPGPADFAKYEDAVPGMGDRLMSMVEADHRARVRAIDSRHSGAIWRILSSAIITTLSLLVAGFCFFMEERVAGCVVTSVAFMSFGFNIYCDSRVLSNDEMT